MDLHFRGGGDTELSCLHVHGVRLLVQRCGKEVQKTLVTIGGYRSIY